jgi:deoxyribodipyrimidine photolyase-related protein
MSGTTAWVLGDQLAARNAALDGADRVLIIESRAKLGALRFHRQKLHLVLSSMRRFAAELRERGLEVDYVQAESFRSGLARHRERHSPERVRTLEPQSRAGRALAAREGVELVRGTLFLTHPDQFEDWANGRKLLRMEAFYRAQRRRLGVLMEGSEPVGGRWNFDLENREPPPADRSPPEPFRPREDSFDAEVRAELDELGLDTFGEDGPRLYAGSAAEAKRALAQFVETRLAEFGAYQDAMIEGQRFMWHSLLSGALNLGLLDPIDCVTAAEGAYHDGAAALASVEGFIRQIIGWREFVWGLYWHQGARWQRMNALRARRSLPEALWSGRTEMRCVADAVEGVAETAYAHHIQRLMVLGNLVLLAGIEPRECRDWFQAVFIDGYEWVMDPNVLGMATYADGGVMASKPYAASGRYIDRMSNHCHSCRYRPDRRTGEEACPFSAMYWDFLERNRDRLGDNHRLGFAYANLERIGPEELRRIRSRARTARGELGAR